MNAPKRQDSLPRVAGRNGRPVLLGNKLGQGGEGTVYAVLSDNTLVAKIYHAPLSPERSEKIRTMLRLRNNELAALTSWPLDLLSIQKSGQPIGLLMPKISGRKDVHHLYSPKSRRSEFQRADWRFLIRAAANTARAFAAVHGAGCVIGDVNHGGVLVAQDATVRLIDCDSFQVSAEGRQFLCEVGVETFTPPELQGRSFSGVIRSENHDAFGLAVMIFLLLFMGRHPFAGRFTGAGDMPIARAIKEVRFPYGSRANWAEMSRPPGTPALSIVGPELERLFEVAFARESLREGRPSARDWVTGLVALEKQTAQCVRNHAHWYRKGSPCPWCSMEDASGVPLFPFVAQSPASALLDFSLLWEQIEKIGHPGPLPQIPHPEVRPSSRAKRLSGNSWKRNLLAVILGGAVTFGAIYGIGYVGFLAGFGVFLWARALGDRSREIDALRRAHDEAQKKWHDAEAQYKVNAAPEAFEIKRLELEGIRRELENLSNVRMRKIEGLRANQRQLQLERFLDSFGVQEAHLPGIGVGRKQILISYGVETAADVSSTKVSGVPGFGPKTIAVLTGWRVSLEQKFAFDARQTLDARELTKVEQEIFGERIKVETRMRKAASELRQAKDKIISARQHIGPHAESALRAYLQAAADFKIACQ